MKKIDAIFVGLLLVGAFWTFIVNSASKNPVGRVQPCDLIEMVDQSDKYISTDELARRLMSDDPTLTLIDLRSKEQFVKYNLPGSINIPIENIMDNENRDIINQNVQNVVFYSNSSELSAKAWMLTKRMGYNKNYILRGGLNQWVETILRPSMPIESASREDFERYNFRKSASAYFGGGSEVGESASTGEPKAIAAPIKRKKKQAAGGGCD